LTFRIDEYTPRWPEEFARQRHTLKLIFAGLSAKVEHIGSTSVSGLCAKPIIDILLGARSLQNIERRIDALRAAAMKKMLIVQHAGNRAACTAAKDPFIQRVLAAIHSGAWHVSQPRRPRPITAKLSTPHSAV
jgi:GrpB-like predicted nucleotidyltransferase (UPF0157 family)